MIADNLVEFVGQNSLSAVDSAHAAPMKPVRGCDSSGRFEHRVPVEGAKAKSESRLHSCFRGVHYEIICYDGGRQRMDDLTPPGAATGSGQESGCNFEPEDIHVMRFGEPRKNLMRGWESYDEYKRGHAE